MEDKTKKNVDEKLALAKRQREMLKTHSVSREEEKLGGTPVKKWDKVKESLKRQKIILDEAFAGRLQGNLKEKIQPFRKLFESDDADDERVHSADSRHESVEGERDVPQVLFYNPGDNRTKKESFNEEEKESKQAKPKKKRGHKKKGRKDHIVDDLDETDLIGEQLVLQSEGLIRRSYSLPDYYDDDDCGTSIIDGMQHSGLMSGHSALPPLKPIRKGSDSFKLSPKLSPNAKNETSQDFRGSSLMMKSIELDESYLQPSDKPGITFFRPVGANLQLGTNSLRWCTICNMIVPKDSHDDDHFQASYHKSIKQQYGLTSGDEQGCIVIFPNAPSDLQPELKLNQWNAIKKRSKKIKQSMVVKSLRHETATSQMTGGSLTNSSPNKKKLQTLCAQLEKLVTNQTPDYEQIDLVMKDTIKIASQGPAHPGIRDVELHILRQLKFIPLIIDLFKRVSVCHKNELSALLKVLDSVIKLLYLFSSLTDNRSYMILTNRIIPLIDLLSWCLNRPTKFIYSLPFVPVLFQIISKHLRHHISPEYAELKQHIIDYIFISGLLVKLKQRFICFYSGLDLSMSNGKVPLAILKSLQFLETLSDVLSSIEYKPGTPQDQRDDSDFVFILEETELVGIVALLLAFLLSDPSYHSNIKKQLPQTLLSLALVSFKFLNNVCKINYSIIQHVMGSEHHLDQVYHLFNYVLSYGTEHYETSENIRHLLNEAILVIGYFTLFNEKNQALLSRGTPTLMQKLCNVNFAYYNDKQLQDVLFPSLISCIHMNPRNFDILTSEISLEMLQTYLQKQIHLLQKADESNAAAMARTLSPQSSQTSLLSVTSANSYSFGVRFPREFWEKALEFIKPSPPGPGDLPPKPAEEETKSPATNNTNP
jgi:hypothetical protein